MPLGFPIDVLAHFVFRVAGMHFCIVDQVKPFLGLA